MLIMIMCVHLRVLFILSGMVCHPFLCICSVVDLCNSGPMSLSYNGTILEHGLKFTLYLALSCGSDGSINASLLPGGERSDVIKSEHCSQLMTFYRVSVSPPQH